MVCHQSAIVPRMYEMTDIPDRPHYGGRAQKAREILDKLGAHAYKRALVIPLIEDARIELLQAAISREAKRRHMRGRTRLEGDKLIVWAEAK